MNAGSPTLPGSLRPNLFQRIRLALNNPQLVGEGGAGIRYLKLQWWVVLWRLLMLVQIPVVALIRPERFTRPLSWEFLMMAIAIGYTFFFYWLATRTRASSTRYLHLIDLAACAALILAASDEKLIFIFMFFSFSSLLARPTTLLRDAFFSSLFLSLAYLSAHWIIGDPPWMVYANANRLGGIALYFFWGIGFVGFSAVMERASALELDSRLEEQRCEYRRRLHDDLGNTLCGLHFKIQSLKRARQDDLKSSLDFLADGYERANAVLKRLLSGIDEQDNADLRQSLMSLCDEARATADVKVELDMAAAEKGLSPELVREVRAFVREALTNAVRHAGCGRIQVSLRRRRGHLIATIVDDGDGFAEQQLLLGQAEGSMGIKGMRERAGLMNAEFVLDSKPSAGTKVELKFDTHGQSGLLARALDKEPQDAGGGVYPYLVRLRMAMYVWTMIQLLVQPAGHHLTLPLAVVSLGLTLDACAWFFFRNQLYRAASKHLWLIIGENMVFGLLLYVTLAAGLPFFFSLYMGVAVIMNGLFFGSVGNILATAVLNATILTAFGLAPAEYAGYTAGARFEPAMQHVVIFFILAVSSGLAGEFVLGLESLQLQAVRRALTRQRERLTADTHRQLHDLVRNLGDEINSLQRSIHRPPAPAPMSFENIESSSTDLKIRLRTIVVSIE